ncbi:MAG TPA: GspE/PulE family protein [Candidatus Paceibacterota bacterium]|nr:GspE/PulE family protein [Candidatus Paceibacterota bacterium]
MPAHFDTDAEDAKLKAVHAAEEEDFARILSEKYGFTYTDLSVIPVNVDALRVIPENEAREAEAVAFDKNGMHLSLAIRNPQNPAYTKLEKALSEKGFIIAKFLISRKSLDHALERYKELSYATQDRAGIFDISTEALETLSAKLTSLQALRAELAASLAVGKAANVSRIFEQVLAAAFALHASDIHIEPEETTVRLRLRLDGLLTDVYELDAHAHKLLLARIKLLSGLKINITDRAQDGRFSVDVAGTEVEIRTSAIPGAYGESVVMRILDPNVIGIGFEELGIDSRILERLKREIRRPNGMLLTTGPTGSGKTTTLYAFLKEIHTPETKIITIEDPIEYHIPGIVQTQVEPNYSFSEGLRSILRQDPDVILVGEIRDGEVAETAVRAALTGHFVFSTLHTNNAAGTFPRLVDLGLDPKSFASSISVAMAQRLVRRLNPDERKQVPTTESEKALIEKVFAKIEDKSLLPASYDTTWVPDPASEDSTGYKGRIGLYEAVFMDDALGEFLRDNPSENDIAKEARRQGYLTMLEQGIIAALNGTTSLEEVFRVVDLPRD